MKAAKAVASILLGATALLKILGLLHLPKWVWVADPIFHVPNLYVVAGASFAELALAIWLTRPGTKSLQTLGWFTAGLAFYHTFRLILGISLPCPCLGRLNDWLPWVDAHSDGLTLLLLLALAWLTRFASLVPTAPPPDRRTLLAGVASGILVWLGLGLWIIWQSSGLVLGGDEGMEAAKVALMTLTPDAVPSAWNDQGWLFTRWLSMFAGKDTTSLRLASFALTLPIPLVVGLMLVRSGPSWTPPLFSLLVFSQLGSPMLASATMEPAAIGVGTLAALPILMPWKSPFKYVAAGFIGAIGLHLKLTAAFALVPAAFLAFEAGAVSLVIFSAASLCGFSLFAALVPNISFGVMLQSHTARPPQPILWTAWVASCGGLIGILTLLGIGRRGFGSWAAGLFSTTIILTVYDPVWTYYSAHFWIPGAAIACFGIKNKWFGAAVASVSFGMFAIQMARYKAQASPWDYLAADFVPIVRKAHPTALFSSFPQSYFSTGIAPKPDLAVLPMKRFWAGYTFEALSNSVASLQPEMMILHGEYRQKVGTNGYVLLATRGEFALYAIPSLRIDAEPPPVPILRRFGL